MPRKRHSAEEIVERKLKQVMKQEDALAFVNYKHFRTSKENRQQYSRAFFYISKRRRVLELVGGGGRLWVVTSFLKDGNNRVYSLAYTLRKCEPFAVWKHLQKSFGALGVSADPQHCDHYPRNDMTDILLDLTFQPTKQIRDRSVIGLSLMNARLLTPSDVKKLEQYRDKVLNGRHVFISYSTQDKAAADELQGVLEAKGHSVWRDVRSIVGGEAWEPALYRALENSDAVLVLLSKKSANSEWVNAEIRRARELLGEPGKLRRLVPIAIEKNVWQLFPALHDLQKIDCDGCSSGFRRVARELAAMQ